MSYPVSPISPDVLCMGESSNTLLFVDKNEDMFEVKKHVHTVNINEAGDYLIAMNRYMEAFAKIVRWGKDDVTRQYKKLIRFVKLMVEKLPDRGSRY